MSMAPDATGRLPLTAAEASGDDASGDEASSDEAFGDEASGDEVASDVATAQEAPAPRRIGQPPAPPPPGQRGHAGQLHQHRHGHRSGDLDRLAGGERPAGERPPEEA